MTQKVFPIPEQFLQAQNTSTEQYARDYARSIASSEDRDAFWQERSKLIDWMKEPSIISNVNYDLDDFRIKWFEDGKLNISVNCLDRHVKTNPYKPAIIWEGDHPSLHKIISFKELHSDVCRLGKLGSGGRDKS